MKNSRKIRFNIPPDLLGRMDRAMPRCSANSVKCGEICIPRTKKCHTEGALGKPRVSKILEIEEEKIRNLPHEEAVILDPVTGRKLVHRKGTESHVDFRMEDVPKMKGSIITHNHPNIGGWKDPSPLAKGRGFSGPDIQLACLSECAEVRAVSSGYNHSMKPPKGGWDRDFYIRKAGPSWRRREEEVYNELTAKIRRGELSYDEAEAEYHHMVASRVAKDTGMQYSRIPVGKPSRVDTQDAHPREKSKTPEADLSISKKIPLSSAVRLERAIRFGFQGNLNVLSAEIGAKGEISGFFQSAKQVYRFEISPQNELSYIESDSRVDACYRGLARLDRVATTKKKCPNSKPCGQSCIPRGKKCRIQLPANLAQEVDAVRSGIGGRESEGRTISSTPQSPVDLTSMYGAFGTAGAIAAGAALVGVPVKTYDQMRQNYRSGFTESARQAREMAAQIDVDEIADEKTHITFATGGFAGTAKGGESLASNLKDLGLPAHHIKPLTNEEFDIRSLEDFQKGVDLSGNKAVAFVRGAISANVRTVLQQGRNPTAVKIAANAYAYSQKHPGREITLVGHSAGGMASREAAEILKEMGVEVRVLAIGSPHYGMTEPVGANMTLASAKDPIVAAGNVMQGNWINSVKGHEQSDYFADENAKNAMKGFLGGTELRSARKDGARLDRRRCQNSKPCGDTCVSKGYRCRVELSPQSVARLRLVVSGLAVGGAIAGMNPVTATGVIAGAALLGMPVATYALQRQRYQEGYEESARMAKKEAESYSAPKNLESGFRSIHDQSPTFEGEKSESKSYNSDPDQITFTVGGFGGRGGKEGDWVGEEVSSMFPDHHVVAIESPEFDVTPKEGDRVYRPDYIRRALKAALGENLKTGRNPVAVRAAARAYAYHQAFPGKPINLVGQSGGTMVVRETAEILERMGVKDVRVVAAAGPYFGLTKPVGITIANPETDPLVKMIPGMMKNRVNLSTPKGHSAYFSEEPGSFSDRAKARANGIPSTPNREVQKVLSEYFDRKRRSDSTQIKDRASLSLVQQIIREVYGSPVQILEVYKENTAITGIFRALTTLYEFDASEDGKFSYVEKGIERKDGVKPGAIAQSWRLHLQFVSQLKEILGRTYSDGVDQILTISISPNGDIGGLFRDGQRLVNFAISRTGIVTQLAPESRSDTYLSGINVRLDANKKRKCVKGISCRNTCIPGGYRCRVELSEIASASEVQELRQSAISLRQSDMDASAQIPPDKDQTIRDLKDAAREKGVYRYSYMTKDELRRAIRAVEEKPAQRERVEKTLRRKRVAKEAIEGTQLAKYAKDWNQFARLAKIAGVNPQMAIAGAVTLASGIGMREYMKYRDRYRDGYQQSAKAATFRAEKIPVPDIEEDNITFTVGGFPGEGSSGEEIKQKLIGLGDKTYENAAGESESDMADRWFQDQHHIVAVESPEFDIKKSEIPKKNPDGSYNPSYLGYLVKNGFGTFLKTTLRKRNESAVDLAAQIYAYANAQDDEGNYLNRDKPIHVAAHSVGGITTDEAMQIIARMPNGKDILERTNIVKLGTPDFGFTSDMSPTREMTITSGQDPFGFLPARNEKRISSVKGRELEDFLDNPEVAEQIRTQFGYHASSTYYKQIQRRRSKLKGTPLVPPPIPGDTDDPRNNAAFGRNPARRSEEAAALSQWLKEREKAQKDAAALSDLIKEVERAGKINEQKAAEDRAKRSAAAKKGAQTRKRNKERDQQPSQAAGDRSRMTKVVDEEAKTRQQNTDSVYLDSFLGGLLK